MNVLFLVSFAVAVILCVVGVAWCFVRLVDRCGADEWLWP